MTDPLRAENLGRHYGRQRPWAIRHLSLTAPEGSTTALVGPNGAGKSTLIRACVGFEPPDEGRALVFGFDANRERTEAVGKIGYVPQATSLYRNLTISDHLAMGAVARPAFDRSYALARVRQAGLSQERVVGELSGGEQAQVALALALGTRAPLLLLDEPLANLDPLARREFLTALVDDVRERGATALLSSHIVTDVEQACDRVVVLAAGKLVLEGAIAEMKERFRTMPLADLNGRPTIGTFSGPSGGQLALVAGGEIGSPASLEEVVLGHLASARDAQVVAA